MTQALAVHQLLSRSGHDLVGAVAGGVSHRPLPEYVTRALPVPVRRFDSPSFALHRGRGVNMTRTTWQTLAGYRRWKASIDGLRSMIEETRPDLIINFFEPLTGLLQLTRPLSIPVVSVAHQHMIGHAAHHAPLTARADQWGLQAFATLVGCRSWKLALSLYPAPDVPRYRTLIGPPILRRELFDLTPTPGDYFLVYILNHGYHEEIRAWHRANPSIPLHCFYDRPEAPEVEKVDASLTFHRLDGGKFLRMMAGCRAVVSTAGFESISEAAWLGKPVYLVPVEHHAEQRWNARDAVQAGLGITDRRFDFDRLTLIRDRSDTAWFRDWVASAPAAIERVVERALS